MKSAMLRSLALLLAGLLLLSGCGGHTVSVNNNAPFDSYGVPVMPLQLYFPDDFSGTDPDVSRSVDVSLSDENTLEITDSYVISNTGDADMSCMAAYPHAMGENWLVDLSVSGSVVDYDVLYGSQESGSVGRDTYPKLLDGIEADFTLLKSLGEAVDSMLEKRVYVYRINATAMPDNPNDRKNEVGVSISYDPETTHIYSDRGRIDGDAIIFPYNTVSCGNVISVGAPIKSYTASGYYDGRPNRWNPDVVIADWFLLLGEEIENYFDNDDRTVYFSEEALLNRARSDAAEIIRRRACVYAIMNHPDNGKLLEDLLPGNLCGSNAALFYAVKSLTIPAGQSVKVAFHYFVDSCVDRHDEDGSVLGSGVEIYTHSGSDLHFTAQSLTVTGIQESTRYTTDATAVEGIRNTFTMSGDRSFVYILSPDSDGFAEQ